ncbi:MAG: DUF1573 domain-containing protein [Chitinispirillaceae bacterium]|nr:DUF1573 domain-containing protein [Chitinispirillaceae bacterium]
MKRKTLILVMGLWLASQAAPRAVIDTIVIPFDTIYEGSASQITHTFRIKNTGDETLEIAKVRKNCGCTSYRYDSLIAPGGFGSISMTVDLDEIQPGDFWKSLILNTNAPLNPVVKLSLSGVLVAYIDVDVPSIVLPTPEKKDTAATVVLSSGRNDLQIKNVRFDLDKPPALWQSSLPVPFRFEATSRKNKQGRWLYKVRVSYVPVEKESQYGSFVLVTNHPRKPEVKIAGVIEPVR